VENIDTDTVSKSVGGGISLCAGESSEGVGTLGVSEDGVESGDLSANSVHFDLSTEGNTLLSGSENNRGDRGCGSISKRDGEVAVKGDNVVSVVEGSLDLKTFNELAGIACELNRGVEARDNLLVGDCELKVSVVIENSGDLSTTVLGLAFQRAGNSGISLGNGGLDGGSVDGNEVKLDLPFRFEVVLVQEVSGFLGKILVSSGVSAHSDGGGRESNVRGRDNDNIRHC